MPRRERLHNNSLTTLNGGITAAATTVTVADGTVFPNEGDFRVIVNEEIMLVTGVSGNDLTVVRGSEGTTAAIQADGAACRCILTAGALEQWADDLSAGYSDRNPYRIMDEGVTIDDTDFTWLNQSTSSVQTETWGGISMQIPNNSSQYNLRGLYITAPSAPWTVKMHYRFGPGAKLYDLTSATSFGLMARESSTGKLLTCHHRLGDGLESWKMTDETTYSANLGPTWVNTGNEGWLMIEDNNTNIITSVSLDGINWLEIGSESRTAHASGGMNQIGFFVDSNGSNSNAWYHINSWIVE